jgi:ABC-2 type transport system permease protein
LRPGDPGAPPAGSADRLPLVRAAAAYVQTVFAMAAAEFHRARHEPTVIVSRSIQPLLWIAVFGAALAGVRGLPTEGIPYQTFIVPGVLAQSVLFVAIFSGLAIVWERDLGITQRVLVTPAARSAVILGKACGAGVRASFQVVLVLVVVALLGVPLRWTAGAILGTVAACLLGGTLFAALSMVIASGVRSREQFMGLGQLITLPLFFASNALYAVTLMPGWLQAVSRVNPLTYEVDILRRLLVGVGPERLLVRVVGLVAATAVAVAVASRTYPRRAI